MARKKKRSKPSRGSAIALRRARGGGVPVHAPRLPQCDDKAIPNADGAFASVASKFADAIAREPDRYNITQADAQMLARRVKEFHASLIAVRPCVRTPAAVKAKNAARKVAEEWMRTIRNQIRGDCSIEQRHKDTLGILARSKTLTMREAPASAPRLKYLCSIDSADRTGGVHVVEFHDAESGASERRPDGAASLHLYFDLIPPGESIPLHPAERGWPKFLREFTRSPMKVEFPVPMSGPMTVVYWGRWSDGKGNTGPWSQACVARAEGTLDVRALPEASAAQRMMFIRPPRQLMGEVAEEKDGGNAETVAAIAMLGQRVLEAATVRLLNAA